MDHLGITGSHLRRVAVVGAILGTILFGVGYVGGRASGRLTGFADIALWLLVSALVAAMLPAFIALAGAFQLRSDGTSVTLSLFGRWPLRRCSLSNLTVISLRGRAFPVVLRFSDGSRMRVLGAPLPEIPAFVAALQAAAPQARVET